MLKLTSGAVIGAVMLGSLLVPMASAQTTNATMPILYNQTGQQVNGGNTSALPAGYYYLAPGGQQQIYYYGNGTYYDPATGEFGGSVNNPNGMAGANLGYVVNNSTTVRSGTTGTNGTTYTPGVPNTGAGGDSASTWVTMGLSALIVLGGATYLVATRRSVGSR